MLMKLADGRLVPILWAEHALFAHQANVAYRQQLGSLATPLNQNTCASTWAARARIVPADLRGPLKSTSAKIGNVGLPFLARFDVVWTSRPTFWLREREATMR